MVGVEPGVGMTQCGEGTTSCDGECAGMKAESIEWRAAPILRQKVAAVPGSRYGNTKAGEYTADAAASLNPPIAHTRHAVA